MVVVYLPVEDNPDAAILIRDGLVTTDQVNHTEACHTKAYIALNKEPLVVGSAMQQGIAHPLEVIQASGFVLIAINHTGDAAHGISPQSHLENLICLFDECLKIVMVIEELACLFSQFCGKWRGSEHR
jgi:hypothetical protein